MKTVAFAGPGKMELREAVEPKPPDGHVVVEVSYCGICGSDIHEYSSTMPSMRGAGVFQAVMGHEFTGIVSTVGLGVNSLKIGDPVAVHPGGPCGNCFFCTSGSANLCAEQLGTGYRMPGAYAERVLIRADQAIKLPGPEWLERAALTEPLGVAMRAINRGGMQTGEVVFIAGGGPIGLLTLLAARHKGAGTVIVSERTESRRALATKLGADQAIDPKESSSLQVRQLTGGMGCDLAVEAVGIAPTMDDCIAATRRGGRIVVAGAFEQPYHVNLLNLLVQEQAIIGTFGYASEFAEACELITSGTIDVSPLISAKVSLEELPATFETLVNDRGRYQKVLVAPNG